MTWRLDIENMPRDRWVLILESDGKTPAVCHYASGFGWTYDGGDRFDPIAWAEITDLEGKPIRSI